MHLRTRATAATLTAAALALPLAGIASAHPIPLPPMKVPAPACTISATDRAAALDALHADQAKLSGHKLTDAEKKQLKAAVAALVQAARDAKMSAADRAAKTAQIVSLRAQLDASTDPTANVAIRAQIQALRLQLKDARLTAADRAAIRDQAKQMYATLRDKPTAADKAVIKADMAAQVAKLHCQVAA